MSGAVEKLLELAGAAPAAPDPDIELLRAAQADIRELAVLLASGDDDGDDDDDGQDGHSGHGTYKALVKRGMPAKRAAAMCARADKRVKASRLAASLEAMLGGTPGRDIGLVTLTAERPREPRQLDEEKIAAGVLMAELSVLTAAERKKPSAHTMRGPGDDYPIPDKVHLASAVARYKQGKFAGHKPEEVAAHIRARAKALGETVDLAGDLTLEEAAGALALARGAMGDGGVIMTHGPFTGTHSHSHFQGSVHQHPHQHFGDNSHEGGPQHRPGSKPGGRAGW